MSTARQAFFHDPDGLEGKVCVANPAARPGVANPRALPSPASRTDDQIVSFGVAPLTSKALNRRGDHRRRQLHDKDAATEVTRLRAGGPMLRSCAPPLMLGLVAAVVEVGLGLNPVFGTGCAALLAAGSCLLIVQGRILKHWASLKTLELCFWLPDIDERFRADEQAGRST